MSRPIMVAGVGLLIAVLCGAAALAVWYERPSHLRIAISEHDAEDQSLVLAAAETLKSGRKPLRLKIAPVADPAAAARAVETGDADLAVVRADVAMPENGQTVVILHRDVALLMAPGGSSIHEIPDLLGHTVGIVHEGAGNDGLIRTALAQYDIALDSVKTVPLSGSDVADALKSGRIDAVLAVDAVTSPRLRDLVGAVASVSKDEPIFIPFSEAEAIAQRAPAYEKGKIVEGAFGGSTPRPSDDVDTLSITHRLVAAETVATPTITDVTRFFLSHKQQLAKSVPVAQQIEAPSTDKDATWPVHEGSAAYIDDDEQTFFDKYSDYIYIGAMLLGVLASGATAIVSQIGRRRTASLENGVARLLAMLSDVRAGLSADALDAYQREADRILASTLDIASKMAVDEQRFANFSLALDQLRAAIRDERARRDIPRGGLFARAAE